MRRLLANGYKQTNLACDPGPQPTVTVAHTDINLVNPQRIVALTAGNLSNSAAINVDVQ